MERESLHRKVLSKWESKTAAHTTKICLSKMQDKNKAAQKHLVIESFHFFEGKNGIIPHKYKIYWLRNSHVDLSWKLRKGTSHECPPEPVRNIDSYYPRSIATKPVSISSFWPLLGDSFTVQFTAVGTLSSIINGSTCCRVYCLLHWQGKTALEYHHFLHILGTG